MSAAEKNVEGMILQGRLTGGSGLRSRRYVVRELVGQGGNAVVYSAWYDDGTGDTEPNAIVKKLRPVVSGMITEDDEEGSVCIRQTGTYCAGGPAANVMDVRREAFVNEAREMRRYQALAICAGLLEVFEYRNTLCVAMQRSGGQTLLSEMSAADYVPDPRALLEDAREILHLLTSLHADGKLHMDISPDNLYRQPNGTIILLDFGSVVPMDTPLEYHSVKRGYSPPEAERSSSFGVGADLYSVGAVLYRGLFGHEYDWGSFSAAEFWEIDDLALNDGCREQLRLILSRALAYTPESRFGSAEEFESAIDEFMRLSSGSGVSLARLRTRSEELLQVRGARRSGDVSLVTIEPPGGGTLIAEKAISWLCATNENVLIYGAGGKGKTTLLHMIWRRLSDECRKAQERRAAAPVPLYISLTGYPDNDEWRGGDAHESYIVRCLCVDLLSAPSIRACTPEQMTGLWEELSRNDDGEDHTQSSRVRYVLIADALDEVSAASHSRAVAELNRAAALPGVRVIVTSRRADLALDGFAAVTLPDINDAGIDRYMRRHGADRTTVCRVRANGGLYAMLRRPLYLNLAGQMAERGEQEELVRITSGAELMDQYYRVFEVTKLERVTSGMTAGERSLFLLAYEMIIPKVAFRMEQESRRYTIDRAELRTLIADAFDNFTKADFLAAEYDRADAVAYYMSLDAAGRTAAGNRMLDLVVHTLCIMNESGGIYEFVNRHIGSYFAARHILNRLSVAAKAVCGDPEKNGVHRDYAAGLLYDICGLPWRDDISRSAYVLSRRAGSASGGEEPMRAALPLMAGERGESARRCVANLVGSLLTGENGVAGMTMAGLDMTGCDLVGMDCTGTDFDGALLSDSVFTGVSRSMSRVILSRDRTEVYVLSGEGGVLVIDRKTGTTRTGVLENPVSILSAGYVCGGRMTLLGRHAGRAELVLEVYPTEDIGGEPTPPLLRRELPMRSPHGVISDISPDGRWLAVGCAPRLEDVESEITMLDLESGRSSTGLFRGGCMKLRLRGDRACYMLYDDLRAWLVSFDEELNVTGSERIECESDIFDICCGDSEEDTAMLLRGGTGMYIAMPDGSGRRLNLPHSLDGAGAAICDLCAVEDGFVVVIQTPSRESDFIAGDDGSPADNIAGNVIAPVGRGSALMKLTGESEEYIGIYNYARDSWDFRVRNSRGMQEAAVNGKYILASRDNLVVLCDMETGRTTAGRMECGSSTGTHWWPSADGKRVCLTRSGRQIQLNAYSLEPDESGTARRHPLWTREITRERLGVEQKVTLSVLSVSPMLERLLISCTCDGEKRVFVYETADGSVSELALAESAARLTAGQFLPDGRAALLGELGRRDLLQLTGADGASSVTNMIDVTEARSDGSTLSMVCTGEEICLVSFGRPGANGRTGCATVRRVSAKAGEEPVLLGGELTIPCTNTNNARASCCYMSGGTLLLKDRFVDKYFVTADLATGSKRRVYIDSVMVSGGRFTGAEGLSEELRLQLSLAGALV